MMDLNMRENSVNMFVNKPVCVLRDTSFDIKGKYSSCEQENPSLKISVVYIFLIQDIFYL